MTTMENAETMETIEKLRKAVQQLGTDTPTPRGEQLYMEIECLIKKLEKEIAK